MKKIIFYVLICVCINCLADIKTFSGEPMGLITDGKYIFSLVGYIKYEKLQIVYPICKETCPLPRHKSFYRYYTILNNYIVTLFDNKIVIYDKDLKVKKKMKLPEVDSEYHFNYSLNIIKDKILIVNAGNKRCFQLNNLELKEVKNQLEFLGNKIEFKKNLLLINSNKIDIACLPKAAKINKFSFMIHFLFVLNKELFLIRNCLCDNSGRLLATLPFTFGVDDAVILENGYLLINPQNIVIINKKGEIIKVIDVSDPYILGNLNQDQILLKLDNQYLGLLSIKTFELKKKDLGEKISSAVFLDDRLFYVPKDNDKTLKIIPIKDIFTE